jgi:serine protease Do
MSSIATSSRRNRPERNKVVGCFFIAVLVAGSAWALQTARGQDEEGAAKAKSLSRAFRAAAHKVIPTVVKITSVTKAKRIDELPDKKQAGNLLDDLLNGEDVPPDLRFNGTIPSSLGIGSGVIIDSSGIILTNNHVVAGADEVQVEFVDGRQLKVTDIKSDEQSDLAIMRVKSGESLPKAVLGDSDAMDIGDWVIAVGCPFELDSTVSAGIISGKSRVLSVGSRASFLQTDAAINPGNSGGPLVNLDGEVIGINTAIASNSGTYEGIGFAIPSNLAKWVVSQLIKKGSVERAYLGVKIGEITGALAEHLGVVPNSGVIVSEVLPDSPAATAKFQDGDIIQSFSGQKIDNPHQLQELVERSPMGSKKTVDVLRGGEKVSLQVEMKALPDKLATRAEPRQNREGINVRGPNFTSEALGLNISALTPDIAKQLGYSDTSGVVVTAVDPQGIAAQRRIRPGSVILRVGQKTVHTVDDFKAALQNESLAKGILLLVRTQFGNRYELLKE